MTQGEGMAVGQSVGWTVTAQRESVKVISGQAVQGIEVQFQTARGTPGSVFLSNAVYNVDNVRAMIANRAAQLDAVDQLTSEN